MLIKPDKLTGVWVPRFNYSYLRRYFMLPGAVDYTYIQVSFPRVIPTSWGRASFVDICTAGGAHVTLSQALLHTRKR
jgi:hypothetical protein